MKYNLTLRHYLKKNLCTLISSVELFNQFEYDLCLKMKVLKPYSEYLINYIPNV